MTLDLSIKYRLLALAKSAVQKAGIYIESKKDQAFNTSLKKENNSLASQIVTEVDQQAQEIILDILTPSMQEFELGLLTEESEDDESRFERDYFWCIDPLDGTLAFTKGEEGYAVSIALLSFTGDPVLSAVYLPYDQTLYSAIERKGLFVNEQPYQPKIEADPYFHLYVDHPKGVARNFEAFKMALEKWVAEELGLSVCYHEGKGAVCNAIGVLQSKQGAFIKLPKATTGGGSIWDFAATRLFFEEAGKYVANASGQSLHLNSASTYMHDQGVVFSTTASIQLLVKLF